jgi:hypothetical protein
LKMCSHCCVAMVTLNLNNLTLWPNVMEPRGSLKSSNSVKIHCYIRIETKCTPRGPSSARSPLIEAKVEEPKNVGSVETGTSYRSAQE